MQITSHPTIGGAQHRFSGPHHASGTPARRTAQTADNVLFLVLWLLLSLACCAAAMAVADVL